MLKQSTFEGQLASALLILIFLAACTPNILPSQETQNNTLPDKVLETAGAKFGDLVTINYELYFENGTLADTNKPELLDQLNNSPYVRGFIKGPFNFILGQSGKPAGFDEAIIGMQIGQTKEETIEPSQSEITLAVNKTQGYKRQIFIPRLQSFPLSSYDKLFGKRPFKGDIVQNKTFAFKYQIVNITEKYAIGKILAKEGEEYTLPSTYWPSQVIKVAEEDILFFQEPKNGQEVPSPFGNATITVQGSAFNVTFHPKVGQIYNYTRGIGGMAGLTEPFIVTEVLDDSFIIKRFGLLTDKKLKLKAEFVSNTPDAKEVRPKNEKLVQEFVDGKEI